MMALTWGHGFEGVLSWGHGADGSWLESLMVVLRRLDGWWNGVNLVVREGLRGGEGFLKF